MRRFICGLIKKCQIFGFRFAENFNYPYIAKSITDFWRRWHISLSSWFRDYVYIPLGGNRVSKSRWILNIFVVWALIGIVVWIYALVFTMTVVQILRKNINYMRIEPIFVTILFLTSLLEVIGASHNPFIYFNF